jgi:hypothetical protein
VTAGLRLGIPAYGYPGFGVWERLSTLPAGTLVVMDPADGPGDTIDPQYVEVVSAAVHQGLRVFGYVTCDYGRRSAEAMVEEVERYRTWYGPCGIFMDQSPASASSVPAIVEFLDHVRRVRLSIAINPGQPDIDPQDAVIADHVVNFEGSHATYRGTRFPGWVRTLPAEKFWHLVYEVHDLQAMHEVVSDAGRLHAAIVHITDTTMPNPWEQLPSYWYAQQVLFSSTAP